MSTPASITLFDTASTDSQYSTNYMEMQARQYLNVSTGQYLVLQPDCNPTVGSAAPNASGNLSLGPNMACPFLPQLAWEPLYPLDGSPYLPAGYFLSNISTLRSVDQNFALMLGSNCNLQTKEILSNGSEIVLWESGSSDNSSNVPYCDQVTLQQDGSLVIRNYNELGLVVCNNVTVAGNASVSWVLRSSPTDGSLIISDIEDSTNVLWTNADPTKPAEPTEPPLGFWLVRSGSLCSGHGWLSTLVLRARTNILDHAEKDFRLRLEESGWKSQTRYSQDKIKQATNKFGNKIGSGGLSDVFYGKLPDGQEIAAKVLSAESHLSKQEFYNEGRMLWSIFDLEAENKYHSSSY